MKFLSRERLSQHKYKTPEGYLICVDSVLARTGKQTYHRDEVFHDGDDTEIEVDRHPDEVFSEQTLASFENKPITVEHPDCDVTCENYKDYAVGFVRDVKRGTVDGQDVILGTLVIQDAKTIDEIEAGEHVELSCGYDCDIKDEENPQQRNIRGNHVALCEQGRAGNARIVDTADDMYGLVKEPTTRYFLAKFFNEKWETDDNVAVIKAKNETEAENKLKRSGIKYDSIRELTHSEYIKFARLTKVIDSTIVDMALSRVDAMDRCISLGKRFIEHFDKIYKNPNDSSVQHWKGEMKGWLDSVKEIKLKNTNKPLLNTELHDWFFTAGANVGDFIKSPLTDEITAYDKFIVDCLSMGLDSAFKNIKSEVTDSMSFVTKKNTSIQDLKRVLGKLSRMYSSDPGIEAVLKELHDAGYEADVDSIRGWDKNRNVPGEQIKRYILKVIVEGKEKHILVELYADESDWKVKEINAYMTDSVADSIKDEISGAYKGWYTKIGYSADNEDALRRYRVEIMRDRDLSYVEADELLKRIDRFLPKKDAVEDETPYEESTEGLKENVRDKKETKLPPGYEPYFFDLKVGDIVTSNRLLPGVRYKVLNLYEENPPYGTPWVVLQRVVEKGEEPGSDYSYRPRQVRLDNGVKKVKDSLTKSTVDDAEVKIVPGMKLKNGNEILVVESNDGEYSIVKTSTGKRYRYSTYDLAENLKMSPTWSVIKDSSKKSTVEDAEKMYKIYVKNAFGAYKVADWPAESKEKAVQEFLELNPRYKKIGIVEARDSVSNSSERTDNSLKTFKVQYTKDSETHIHLVKAKTVQDALKKVNDYRDLDDMTNAILQCNKDMESAKDKGVEYLACKSLLEDIVNQADPKVKEHWRQEKDNWLKAMKAKYNV